MFCVQLFAWHTVVDFEQFLEDVQDNVVLREHDHLHVEHVCAVGCMFGSILPKGILHWSKCLFEHMPGADGVGAGHSKRAHLGNSGFHARHLRDLLGGIVAPAGGICRVLEEDLSPSLNLFSVLTATKF